MKKCVDDPSAFLGDGGYHFEEKVKMNLLVHKFVVKSYRWLLFCHCEETLLHVPTRLPPLATEQQQSWAPPNQPLLSTADQRVWVLGRRSREIACMPWVWRKREKETLHQKERKSKEKDRESLGKKETKTRRNGGGKATSHRRSLSEKMTERKRDKSLGREKRGGKGKRGGLLRWPTWLPLI